MSYSGLHMPNHREHSWTEIIISCTAQHASGSVVMLTWHLSVPLMRTELRR